MAGDCIFCRIVAGDAPSAGVYADDAVVAILDIFPWAPGHTLVIPRSHAATIFDISAEDAAAVMAAAHRLAPVVRDAVGADGLNLLQSNGRAAWQTVDHLHLHLIPRFDGDKLVAPASGEKSEPAEIEGTARRIRQALD